MYFLLVFLALEKDFKQLRRFIETKKSFLSVDVDKGDILFCKLFTCDGAIIDCADAKKQTPLSVLFDGAYFLEKTIDVVHLLPKFIIQSKPLFGQLLMYVMLMCVIFNKINVLFLTVVIPRNKLILMRLLVEDIVMSKTY